MNKALPLLVGGGIILAAVLLSSKKASAATTAGGGGGGGGAPPPPNNGGGGATPYNVPPQPQPQPQPAPTPAPRPTNVANTPGSASGMYSATQIKCVQAYLLANGFYAGKTIDDTNTIVDAAVGPQTEAAIKAFQLANGLTPTGFINADVMSATGCP
jgi:peptidoglycan hydrolase-like protein with peptidoglycan-binding domain